MDLAALGSRIKVIIPFAPLEMGNDCRAYLDELKSILLVKGGCHLWASMSKYYTGGLLPASKRY